MKVLITGSTGFVGKNLQFFLAEKGIIIEPILRDKLVNISANSIQNTDVLIHLAGKAHDLKKTSTPDEYYTVNFELTKQLHDAFLKSDAKKFIFVSSVKASADVVEGVLTEENTPNPQTHYGKSKLMAEEYIQSQKLPNGKSYYILRPCMIHGPGNKGNLNLLYKFVQKGIPYPLAAFKNKRSFLSVENLCFVINELISREDIASGVYNVSDDEALSTNEVVSILAQAMGRKPKLWSIPSLFITTIAKLGDVLRLPLTTERLNKLTENYIVSNSKIKLALDKPLPLPVREGLKVTANSFNKLSAV